MAVNKLWVPERRDVLWINCNPSVGQEMKDEHPFLVLSPKLFNEKTDLVIGFPMTTKESNETNPFAVKFKGQNGVVSYILAHQPKSFDWREREARPHPMKHVQIDIFTLACETLNQIIAICE